MPYTVKPTVIYTSNGGQVTVLRKQMPYISEILKHFVFYLYQDEKSAMEGGKEGGTGFFIYVESEKGRKYIYAVTNRHVIEKGYAPVIPVNKVGGGLATIPMDYYDWHFHPDDADVAVASIDVKDTSLEFAAMPSNFLLPREFVDLWEINLGSDVYMLGRFVFHSGKTFNILTARSGIISAMPYPDEKIPVSNMPPQEAFLVEMRSLSGYSGSPTFFNMEGAGKSTARFFYKDVQYNMEVLDEKKYYEASAQHFLLGIDAGNFPMYEKVIEKTENGEKETDYRAINHSGFSIVIPSWKITETLNLEEFVMERKKQDKQAETKEGSVRLDFSENEKPSFTEADFQNALTKASRKISEPEKETKETSE